MAISNANKSPEHVIETPPTSTESESSFSPEDPRPRYYICRDDKTLVPLIAVDELPPIIRLHGVPLSLAAADIEEWDMSRCGDVIDRAKNLYRIEFNTNSSSYQSAHTRKEEKRKTSEDLSGDDAKASSHTQAGQKSSSQESGAAPEYSDCGTKSIDYESVNPAGAAGDYEDTKGQIVRDYGSSKVQHPSKTPNAATPGIYGRKKYCTYWIRTGNCDYIQEGCKFLHVIPDAETRLRIGIRDMPRWAREEIPAPEDEYLPKRQTGTGQDWRRQPQQASRNPPLGRVTELPEISASQARPALTGTGPLAYTDQGNVQDRDPDPRFMHFTSQQSPNDFKHANQHDQTRLDTTKSNKIYNSASAADQSFQRQMQSYRSLSPSPASTPPRSSPQLQPPIARPTTNAYTAPDKVSNVGRAANVAQNPFGRGFSRNYPNSAFLKTPPGIDTPGSSLFRNSQQPRTPMDARFANMSLGSSYNTGTAESGGYRAPDLMSDNVTPLSSGPFGSRYPDTFQAANEGTNQDAQFNGNVSPSFFTQPTVTHKRRFVTPGESKFVVTSIAEENGSMTATASAGHHPGTTSDRPRSHSGQRRGRSGERRCQSGQHRRANAKAQNGNLVDTSP